MHALPFECGGIAHPQYMYEDDAREVLRMPPVQAGVLAPALEEYVIGGVRLDRPTESVGRRRFCARARVVDIVS